MAIEDLEVGFVRGATAVAVLHGVSLTIAPGECVAVVGESGAGKSVLSRAVLGLAGEGGSTATVRAQRFDVAGHDVRGYGQRRWRRLRGSRVGLVLQDALGSLDPLRTVGAEVGETLAARAGGARTGRAGRRAAVEQALADAGLDLPAVRAAQRSGDLSGGMRQRALIASAIIGSPDLLVLDEPTTALDATVAAGVLALLGRLRDGGTAMLLVSHDLRAVARVADRVVVLENGRVVEEGPTAQVLQAPAHPYTQRLVAAVPRGAKPGGGGAAEGLQGVRVRGRRRCSPPPGCAAATRCRAAARSSPSTT
ncbi:hypothetical protein C8046_00170 [Serinibacter arcticus]|uniref:ABC transporter domain-containing protein n=1 Tax=Serinibacter arcticus TaxID=1655435 RepID=A0A2U1ZZ32_9MICO|nr:hypothetical protein C8046_00170 [Serinibacter arcticus]